MAFQQVILTEKVYNLGAEADVVKVRAGFARNFLLPQGKALEATPKNLQHVNRLKAKRAEREARELNEANDLARRINKLKITIELETGETGKAFGSVTTADLVERLRAELGGKVEIDRHKIDLERPIKETGTREIEVRLHPDVTAQFQLTVKAKGAEAGADEEKAEAPDDSKPGEYKARPKAKHAK
jgi:large subunit ribosomal protein L9